jgi:hypothetical protein
MWLMESLRTVGTSAAWLIAPVSSQMPAVIARRWAALLLAARAISLAVALGLLAVEGLTERELVLGLAGGGYAVVSTVLALRHRRVRRLPAFWAVDAGVALLLVLASGDWRSPFYLLWLTALAIPAVRVSPRRAAVLGGVAAGAFLAVAFAGGPEPFTLDATSSETFAIHLVLPALTVSAWPTPPTCCGSSIASAPVRRSWPSRPSVAGSPGSCTTPRSSGCMPPTCC